MAVSIQADTPIAAQLSTLVQPKLVDLGWSTEGSDDTALAEYIVLMLVNGKTRDQIASELSNDLLSLGPEDQNATDFAAWLFQQVEMLMNPEGARSQDTPSDQTNPAQAIPSFTGDSSTGQHGGDSVIQDSEMGDAGDSAQSGNIPTGPKSMRNGGKPTGKRLMGQLNRAMDRANDSPLHRVRSQGQERINSHNRQPPKGPRANGGPNRFAHGVPSGPGRGPGGGRGPSGGMGNMAMSQQQQTQLLQMMEQQAQMMSSLLTPQQQQQLLMPSMGAPSINPNFRGNHQNKSLFDRVQRPNGHQGKHHNGNGFQGKKSDVEKSEDVAMDLEGGQSSELGPETTCKFNLKCTKADCIFAHQSPAAPPGTTIDVNDHCSFGAACQNRKCVARHPSPAQRKAHQAEQDCKFFPNCTNASCPFRHPDMPPCRFGSDCNRTDCKFTHVQTKCKFNPCLNPTCVYKHDEGQKRSKFGDMVWTADGAGKKEHVSERKFVDEGEDREELIIPGAADAAGNQNGGMTEVVT